MNRRLGVLGLTVITACVVLLPASAVADTFKFVGTTFRSCWEDTEGFTASPDLQPNPLPAGNLPGTHFVRQVDFSTSTTVILNTDGTLSETGTSTLIRNTATSRVAVSELTCSGPWTFDGGTQRLTATFNCNFTHTIGGANTGTITTQAVYRLAGTILVRVDPPTPFVDIVNVVTGANAPFSYQRVCGVSGTLHFVQ